MKRSLDEVLDQANELQTEKSLKVQKVSTEICKSSLVTNDSTIGSKSIFVPYRQDMNKEASQLNFCKTE